MSLHPPPPGGTATTVGADRPAGRLAGWRAGRLAELSRYYAAELRAGRIDLTGVDTTAGWHVRAHGDDRVDVWVIRWLPGQATRLHDHGGSAGAFTVVEGSLTEAVWSALAGRLLPRAHRTRTTVTFGATRVHDVRNLADQPTLSVHAYSPPLTRLTFYDSVGELVQAANT